MRPAFIQRLAEPARHAGAARVEVHETHISWVLVAGHFAYKIKKPVDFGFLDYSTPEKRRAACEAELELNRRLAPDLYLDVLPITGTADAPALGGDGPAFEYAVRMASFPQDALLDRIARAGALSGEQVDDVATAIAAFHARIARSDAHGGPDAVHAPVRDNLRVLGEILPASDQDSLRAIGAWSEARYAALEPLLARRRAEGWVRECHGDLHLGNVAWLDGAPVPFDGIEFSAELRWIDIQSEAAFFTMDLLDHGLPELAWRFYNRWLEETGDYAGVALARYYLVYRAMVRAKVAALRAEQSEGAGREADLARTHHYLALAERLTRAPRRFLAATVGYSGSGKSTAARAVAGRFGAIRLRSDVERKRLAGLDPLARTHSGVGSGLYAPDIGARTYARLHELAGALLAEEWPVVIDAACLKHNQRAPFRDLAAECGAPFFLLHCDAPRAELEARIRKRQDKGQDASEANADVLAAQIRDADPIEEGEATRVIEVPEPKKPEEALAAIARSLSRR